MLVLDRALELAAAGRRDAEAADEVAEAAGGDRALVEVARDRAVARVHARVDDFQATGALQLLNQALGRMPIHDPLDWRVRWTQRFRKP